MSARNHINEVCEVFLDGTGKKEREKSIQEHSENIVQLLPIEIKFAAGGLVGGSPIICGGNGKPSANSENRYSQSHKENLYKLDLSLFHCLPVAAQ